MKNLKFIATIITVSAALVLQGCSSSGSGGSPSFSGSYRYGTGPNKTKPRPQTEKVNINGIGGAVPKYEYQRVGGCNKDYRVLGKNYMIWNGTTSYIEEGIASWYGPGFHGQKTSNGEIYDQKGFTAAHKNLPLPSYLKVTNLRNGKKVIVRVNDRGPFVGDRILDLSEGSARAIDMVGTGTSKVRIELINVSANGTYTNAYGKPAGTVRQQYAGVVNKNTSTYQHIGAATSRSAGSSNTGYSNTGYANTGYIKTNNQGITSNTVPGWYVQLVACNSDLMANEIKNNVQTKISYPIVIRKEGNINKVLVGPLNEASARNAAASLKKKGYTDCFVKSF